MNLFRRAVLVVLLFIALAVLAAPWICRESFETQHRDAILAMPSAQYWLGTDELGRDRFARLLFGTRTSLMLAPVAAFFSLSIAGMVGLLAGYIGGAVDWAVSSTTDLMLSVPWLFLLIAARAALPMNIESSVSLAITFGLLAVLGWAAPARIVRASTFKLAHSDCILRARAAGSGGWRIVSRHILPNVVSVLKGQFWILAPAYLLSEANLGIVGLGVSPPATSLGTLIREIENIESVLEHPVKLLPAAVLIVVAAGCRIVAAQPQENQA